MSDLIPKPVRILIADDHGLFREGLRALLGSLAGFLVVAEAATGGEAVTQAALTRPDVILTDIGMPDLSGVEATRRILAENPHIGILMVMMFDDDESVFTAMRAGARGYLLKGADQSELVRAITAVANGEALFSPGVAGELIRFFAVPRPDLPVNVFPDLTERERGVLNLIAQGKGNAAIARELDISGKTVRNHVSSVFSKLQVADRAQAILRAQRAGFGHTGEPTLTPGRDKKTGLVDE